MDEQNVNGLVRLKLIADTPEQKAGWLLVLHWLADGLSSVQELRRDPRMLAGGVAPRHLTDLELTLIRSSIGLLDLPFSSLRSLLVLLQRKSVLGVTNAYGREYLLYMSFQAEIYCYQSSGSDRKQRLSGIESTLQACDGINFDSFLTQLCIVNYGKLNSLSYREQMAQFKREREFVALSTIQAGVAFWVARRSCQMWPERHPSGQLSGVPRVCWPCLQLMWLSVGCVAVAWWRAHSATHQSSKGRFECRLRTLQLLRQLVRANAHQWKSLKS